MSAEPRSQSDSPSSDPQCDVCGKTEEDPRLLTSCYGCRQTFHLNPYAAAGTDCGDVWTGTSPDHEFTGLQLYCDPCFSSLLRWDSVSADGERLAEMATLQDREALRNKKSPPRRITRLPWRRRYRRLDTSDQ